MVIYHIVYGSFVIARGGAGPYLPDGDTLRFEPDDPAAFLSISRRGPAPDRVAAVRFEAIDALEKDQERLGATKARDQVFELLGLGRERLELAGDGFGVVRAEPGTARGYVLTNAIDKHGRVVGFVFPGAAPRPDGALVDPSPDDVRGSVNVRLLEEGLVYATFYSTLAPALRAALAEVSRTARAERRGLWARAVGTPQRLARIANLTALRELVLFPTLHRRLDDYLKTHRGFDGLSAWIRADADGRNKVVWLFETNTFTDLPGILEADGSVVRLTRDVEEFVFVDTPPIDPPVGTEERPRAEVAPGDVIIVGVLANPAGPDDGAEAVTLLNVTSEPIDLAGWTLNDNAGQEGLRGLLPAGRAQRVVLEVLRLGNVRDALELRDARKTRIDRVAWTTPPPAGRTLVFPWPRPSL